MRMFMYTYGYPYPTQNNENNNSWWIFIIIIIIFFLFWGFGNNTNNGNWTEVKMTKEMSEGEIKFTVDGYKDLAGNEGYTLTNANINHGDSSIKLDK